MKQKLYNPLSTILIIAIAISFILPSYAYARGEGEFIGYIAIILLVIVLILLACREIVCWYWKINEIVYLLTDIRELLRNPQKGGEHSTKISLKTVPKGPTYCPTCQKSEAYIDANGDLYCPNCQKIVSK